MIMSIFFLLGAFRMFYYVIWEAAERKTAAWRVMFGLLGLTELLLAFYLSPFSAVLRNLEELETVYHYLIRAVVVIFLILGWSESKNLESRTQRKVKSYMLRVYIALLIYLALKYL